MGATRLRDRGAGVKIATKNQDRGANDDPKHLERFAGAGFERRSVMINMRAVSEASDQR